LEDRSWKTEVGRRKNDDRKPKAEGRRKETWQRPTKEDLAALTRRVREKDVDGLK
jgi:hypothetical protein